MTNQTLQNILDKAQKLQALAERAGTPEEAANAASKLQDLMMRYNISEADVQGHVTDEGMDKQEYDFEEKRNYRSFASTLFYNIAKVNLCEAVYNPRSGKSTIIGKKHNILVTQYLFAYLSREIKRLADESTRNVREHRAQYRRTFCIGAMSAVIKRLKDAKRTVQHETSNSNAIVLAEEGLVQKAFRQAFPRTSKGSGPSVGRTSGYYEGRAAGDGISLNEGVAGKGAVGQLA
jgi:hypothetical protein